MPAISFALITPANGKTRNGISAVAVLALIALQRPLLIYLFEPNIAASLGVPLIIGAACLLLLCAVLCGHLAQSSHERGIASVNAVPTGAAVGGRAVEDLLRLVRSPYLLAIAGLIVVGVAALVGIGLLVALGDTKDDCTGGECNNN